MKVQAKGVKEVMIGRSESGAYEYHDTGKVVNIGDKAYMVLNENAITGATDKVFFISKEAAEKFK